MANAQSSGPRSLHEKISPAVSAAVGSFKLIDETTSNLINAQLLSPTPTKWLMWDNNTYYVTRQNGGDLWTNVWDLKQGYTRISPQQAMSYASGQPDIQFFMYVKPGGQWDILSDATYYGNTAVFFGYRQKMIPVNKSLPPGGLRNTSFYLKVDYMNRHVVSARRHGEDWRRNVRPQMKDMLNDIRLFGQDFDRRYNNLLALSRRISNGDRNAEEPFRNELRALQNISRQAAQKARNKRATIVGFVERMATDARNFAEDYDKVSNQISGNMTKIATLKSTVDAARSAVKNDSYTSFIPFFGLVESLNGDYEKDRQKLRDAQYKLNTAQREEYSLELLGNRIHYLMNSAKVGFSGALALTHSWDAINATFDALLRAERIDLQMTLWIDSELQGAKNEWTNLQQLVNSLN